MIIIADQIDWKLLNYLVSGLDLDLYLFSKPATVYFIILYYSIYRNLALPNVA